MLEVAPGRLPEMIEDDGGASDDGAQVQLERGDRTLQLPGLGHERVQLTEPAEDDFPGHDLRAAPGMQERRLGVLESGDCFGETSYVQGAKRTATVKANGAVTVLKVSSTLLEQVSASCQLRFNRVFLRGMISRLQNAEQRVAAEAAS